MITLQQVILGIMCINVAILYYLVLSLMSEIRDLRSFVYKKDQPRRRRG